MVSIYKNFCPKCSRRLKIAEVEIRGNLPVCNVCLTPLRFGDEMGEKWKMIE